jgi:chromosome partitioning protein
VTADTGARVIAVANEKGGVGKTTVAMHLGAALSRRHRVLVVDSDGQRSTEWWADNVPGDLPFDLATCQDVAVLRELPLLGGRYDYVIVDTPGGVDRRPVVEAVHDVARFVVVPLTPEPLAVIPTVRTIEHLIGPRQLRHAVLLNRIDGRVPSQLTTWRRLLDTRYGYPRFSTHLRQYQAHADAPALGHLVTTLRDNRRTAGAISDITRIGFELTDQFAPHGAGRW